MKIASIKNSKLLLKYGIKIDTDIVAILLKHSLNVPYSTVIRFEGFYVEIHNNYCYKTMSDYMQVQPKNSIAIPRPTLDELMQHININGETDVDLAIYHYINEIRKQKRRKKLNQFLEKRNGR